jgi:hypothetical protein
VEDKGMEPYFGSSGLEGFNIKIGKSWSVVSIEELTYAGILSGKGGEVVTEEIQKKIREYAELRYPSE